MTYVRHKRIGDVLSRIDEKILLKSVKINHKILGDDQLLCRGCKGGTERAKHSSRAALKIRIDSNHIY